MADVIQDAILAQVPTSGEVEMGQLVKNLHLAGAHDAPGMLLRYKQSGVLKYRLDRQENGEFLVMISRKGGE
jgi:hypothetical protein